MRGISGAKSAYMGTSEGKTEYIRGTGRAARGRVRRTERVLQAKRIKRIQRIQRIKRVILTAVFLLAFGAIFLKIKSMIKSGEIELPKYDEIHIMAKKAKTEGVPAKHLISVKGLSQEKIPTGCEAVTTVTALCYWNVNITADRFIDAYLPKEDFYRKNGEIYGPDPHRVFAGDPYSSGLGCFSEVIVTACAKMKNQNIQGMQGLTIKNVSGTECGELEKYIAKDIPVIFWATINMKAPSDGMKYKLSDNSSYTWKAGEHCLLLIGYDSENYFFCDPLQGGAVVSYGKTLVKTRYEQMGRQAVVIYKGLQE